MSSTTAPKFPLPEFNLQMASSDEDVSVVIQYRGHSFMVEFLPDEDLGTPSGAEHEIPLSDAQEAAFDREQWWYHHLAIQSVGDHLLCLEPAHLSCLSYPGRLPSFEDHSELVFKLCDDITDRMQAHHDRMRVHRETLRGGTQ